MKSIIHLPDDLFLLVLKEQGIPLENADPRNFSDVPGVTFLSVRLPNIFLKDCASKLYQKWPESSRTYDNRSILDFEKKSGKKEFLFPFLMVASKNGTTLCSLHASETPKLCNDCRPPFLVMVNAGKRTRSAFVRPFIEYREYIVPPLLRGIVSSFYSGYQSLIRSGCYCQDAIDAQAEEVFSDVGKRKERNIILKTLPH